MLLPGGDQNNCDTEKVGIKSSAKKWKQENLPTSEQPENYHFSFFRSTSTTEGEANITDLYLTEEENDNKKL